MQQDNEQKVETGDPFQQWANGDTVVQDTEPPKKKIKKGVPVAKKNDEVNPFQQWANPQKKNGTEQPTNGLQQPISQSQLPTDNVPQETLNPFKGTNRDLFLQSLSLNNPITVGDKSVSEFNKEFEDITGYKNLDSLEAKSTGLLTEGRDKRTEEKKFSTYSKEKEKINEASKKIFFGAIDANELSALQKNPYTRNIVNNVIREYLPEVENFSGEINVASGIDNPKVLEQAARRIKEKNRINVVDAERESIEQLDNGVNTTLQDFNKGAIGSAGVMTEDIDALRKSLSIQNLNDNDQISNAIDKINKIENLEKYYLGEDVRKKSVAETQRLKKTLNDRIFYNVSRNGVSPTLSQLGEQIEQVVIGKTSDAERAESATPDVTKDQIKVNQFKLGLTALEKSNPILFKTVYNSIALKKDIANSDFTEIASIGQKIDNAARFRGGAYNPNLIDSETNFDYSTFGQKKAVAAAQIGEWMKDNGYKNVHEFPEKLIKQAAKELDINPNLTNSLVFDEKLGGYDAIPKSGWLDDIVAGISQPFEGINSTLNSWSESPVETYLRSSSLQPQIGTQKTPDEQGNISDILPSERNKFTTNMFRGLGQFIPQVLLTKGVGSGLTGVGRLAGFALEAKQAKNVADYSGTFVSTFLQSYGQSYEEHLKKTGNENEAALIGSIDGTVSALFEEILPDVKIADKAFGGLKNALTSDIIGLVKNGGDPADLAKKARPFIEKFFKSATNTIAQENLEELGTQYVDYVTESLFDPQSAKDRNVNKELWNTFTATTAAMFLPAILGASGGSFQKDFTVKNLHSSALNYDKTKESLQKSLDKEYISQDEFNKAVQILGTHKQSIDAAPELNAEGKELTPQQKLDYAFEDTKVKVYKDKANKSSSAVEKTMWEEKIKDAEEIQKNILIPSQSKTEENGKSEEAQKANETEGQKNDVLIQKEGVVEEAAPLIKDLMKQELTYEQKYKEVEFNDPVLDATKKMSAKSARSLMEKRHTILDNIVNCLT